jgi:hypothetical protein
VARALLRGTDDGGRAGVADAAGFSGSILPAAWSLMLALRSRGPVAYFTGSDFQPTLSRPIEQVTYFNGWRKR